MRRIYHVAALLFTALAGAQPATTPIDTAHGPVEPAMFAHRDSTERFLAFLELRSAEEECAATRFLRRLIPRVQLGASFGVREIVFPEIAGAYALPKDSYRLTVSISLSELLDDSQHNHAAIRLEKAKAQYRLICLRQSELQMGKLRRLSELLRERSVLLEQEAIIDSLAQYYELRFQQGKAEFNTLAHARLELLDAKKALQRIEQQIQEIQQ